MIIFFGGFEIIAILLMLLAAIVGTAKSLISMINFFIVFFAIKNIVQTIILGFFKNKNPLWSTIVFLLMDFSRMAVFFFNLKKVALTFLEASGLRYFGALFGFVLYVLICGAVFLMGEFGSMMQALGDTSGEKHDVNWIAIVSGISTVLLLALITWFGYG